MNFESKESVLIDTKKNSKNLIIAFAGIYMGLGMATFEFFNFFKDFSCDKIFVRDFKQVWYHQGLPGFSNSFEETKEKLHCLINAKPYEKVIFIGNSAGGYASILFGSILGVDQVIAFSPQIYLSKWNRLKSLDFRWAAQIKNLRKVEIKHLLDLQFFLINSQMKTVFDLHYCEEDRLDNHHAKKLKGVSQVIMHPYKEGGHGLIKFLRDSGELSNIVIKSLK